jgi:hypothetical protein
MGLFSRFFVFGSRKAQTGPVSSRSRRPKAPASAVHLQRGDEGFLRDVDLAELPHLLLAFLLLLPKFALPTTCN